MSLVLHSAAVTDIGLGRANNEDSVHSGSRLIAVADGIGGMPAGELASAIVMRELVPLDEVTEPVADPLAVLRDTVAAANRKIRDISDSDQASDGMGTTVTALLLADDQLAMLHVGDSRGYLLHDGELTQITKDDTYVQTLVDQGLITLADAKVHPRRSVVMQAVQGLEYEPTCTLRPAVVGDRYLLCSDGLSDVVDEDAIADALGSEPDPPACAQLLVNLALEAGAPDNVTVVIADVAIANAVDTGLDGDAASATP
jgi:serine/threonine protein phosphatase PrpC